MRLILQRMRISIILFMLLRPLAQILFRLDPLLVGWDASKTIRQGVDTELAFQTALHGMKF